MKRLIFIAIAGIWVVAATAMAQTGGTSQVSGTVKDLSGAVVPGAEVAITQTSTGMTRNTVSGGDGSYLLAGLPVGPYKLQVSMPGFNTYVQSGIELQLNSNPVINPVLKVGAISETIEVNANASMVETKNNSVGQVIDQVRVLELPLNGRQVSQLVELSGAAVVSTAGAVVTNKNYPTTVAFAVAGGQANATQYFLDGGSHMDTLTNVGLPLPFPDALREFKVETSSLPADYGNHAGGAVSVVTKSGGNDFHGSAFEFNRYYKFNARNYFALTRDSLKRNQFGGVLGGPILKNKLFFFGGYQGTKESTAPSTVISYTATAATLQGDFTQIASPACNSGKQVTLKAPFVNNQVAASSLNAVALKSLSLMPTSTDACGKVQYGIPNNSNEHQVVGKADWQQSTSNSTFVRYFLANYGHAPTYADNILTTGNNTYSVGLRNRVQAVVISNAYAINPKLLSTTRVGFTRSRVIRYNPENVPTATELGVNMHSQVPDYVNFIVNNYFTFACQNCAPGPFVTNALQLSQDVGWIRGSHQISMGGMWIHAQEIARGNFQVNGRFTFNGNITGNALADFMLGKPVSFLQGNAQVGDDRLNSPSFYIQDNWKKSSRLTVNLGLRWDPFVPQTQVKGMVSHFEPELFDRGVRSKAFTNAPVGLMFPGDDGFPGNSGAFKRLALFSPRVGIVYDPRGKGEETIRIGYGVFYETNMMWPFIGFSQYAPWGNAITLNAPAGGLSNPWQGYPGGDPFPTPNPPPSTIQFPTDGIYMNMPLHVHPPQTQQWNLSLQKQLPKDWFVSVNYIGNKTTHLWLGNELNPGVYIPGASTSANLNQRRVLYLKNPAEGKYLSSIRTLDDGANSNYNGLLLSVQHRMASNFTVNANYTYSHCISDGESGQDISISYQDPNNRRASRGNCAADRRQLFNSSVVVNTPKLGRPWLVKITGNWQLSGIFKAQAGGYSTVLSGRDNTLIGINLDRPNLVGDPTVSSPTIDKWFNAAAFEQNAAGAFGNVGRFTLLGPGNWNLDMALTRGFYVKERHRIDIRAEAFNVFNHTRFNNPNTTLTSTTFGKITTSMDPRIMQFALKYTF
jgi:hypothetical protein